MFHIYEGFHLVDAYHKVRHQRKYNPDTKRAIKIALVAVVTLLLWNMPAEWYGIQNLTVIQQRYARRVVWHPEPDGYPAAYHRHLRIRYADVDSRDSFLLGYISGHHCIDALVLYRQWHPTDGERGGSW